MRRAPRQVGLSLPPRRSWRAPAPRFAYILVVHLRVKPVGPVGDGGASHLPLEPGARVHGGEPQRRSMRPTPAATGRDDAAAQRSRNACGLPVEFAYLDAPCASSPRPPCTSRFPGVPADGIPDNRRQTTGRNRISGPRAILDGTGVHRRGAAGNDGPGVPSGSYRHRYGSGRLNNANIDPIMRPIRYEQIRNDAAALCEIGNRFVGNAGEAESREYIKATLLRGRAGECA